MRLAGFDLLFIGIESFNQNSLIETAKVQNTKLELVTIIKEIQSYGFTIVAGLIFLMVMLSFAIFWADSIRSFVFNESICF